ncbi:Glycine-rich cell wall structural protein precursor [hydrothermal vent metagenome]|uniref:Glycine-rich cell wall structural protein n=1 Tax=hydrothermal vent metagenome TaxID=652676 RepID=A0A3B0RGK1_9ZZZZ
MALLKTASLLKFGALVSPIIMLSAQPVQARDRNVEVTPYLEVQQVLVADLKNGTDVLTYTTVAAGIEASLQTRQAEAQVNLRYERRFFYSDGLSDDDIISGIARGSVQVVPNVLAIEAGGIATRSRVDIRGASPSNTVGITDNVTQVYSVYAGPSLSTNVGALDVNANYRVGYTKVESGDPGPLPLGQRPVDVFDDSVSHSVSASVGMQPGELPIGWSVSGGWEREDAGQLDQRFEGKYARADVTVPVSPTLAIVGGIGYEDIEISERDAVRDAAGDPVIGADGRLVTDETSPRLLSYDQDGLIWDAGVMWRPSRRTSLEARVGQRYDSVTYYGNFGYQPNESTSLNIAVYDTVSGFGSLLNDNLALLGTSFSSNRNPLSGELSGCAFGQTSSLCFNDALQSATSSNFRARGVNGQLAYSYAGWNTALGVGYSRRRFFASQLGALPGVDGLVDENYYANFYVGRQLDARSSFDANVYANLLDGGVPGAPNVLGLGANAAYYRQIIPGLSGTAAVGLDSFKQDGFDSELTASALLGLRYDF